MMPQHEQWTACADLYDLEYDDWTSVDLPFYLELAKARPPLLELACGTGRLAIPIARAGVVVVGIDASADMLRLARSKAGSLAGLSFVEGLMESFELDQRFGTIVLAFSSFYVLSNVEAQEKLLHNIRRHLAPDGRVVMDMATIHSGIFGQTVRPGETPPSLRLDRTLRDPQTGLEHQFWQSAHHDPGTQQWQLYREVRTVKPGGEFVEARELHLSGRYVHSFEFAAMLDRCGLGDVELYGGYGSEPFDERSSARMVWIAKSTERCYLGARAIREQSGEKR